MGESSLSSLVVELFTTIQLLAGYPVPETGPDIHIVPHAVIEEKICRTQCKRIKAFYHPDWGVYLDESLDVAGDAFDRSILLHELMHHVQHSAGAYETLPSDCERRNAEEHEAYKVQNKYLAAIGDLRRVPIGAWKGPCRD
jgi:uncharacterized protein DUF6647